MCDGCEEVVTCAARELGMDVNEVRRIHAVLGEQARRVSKLLKESEDTEDEFLRVLAEAGEIPTYSEKPYILLILDQISPGISALATNWGGDIPDCLVPQLLRLAASEVEQRGTT